MKSSAARVTDHPPRRVTLVEAAAARAVRVALARDRDLKPGPVPKEVLEYWRQKGLRPAFDWRDVWGKEHDAAFSAAKVMRTDVLAAMQEELDAALTEGLTYEQFVERIKPRLQKLGWWEPHTVRDPKTGKRAKVDPPKRIRLIFDTNLRVARAAGQWDRIERQKKLRPYLLYQIGPAERHREQHVAWHGLLLPVDDPFWRVGMPPNGFNCHCHVRSVTRSEYKQLVKHGILSGEPKPILDDEGNPTGHVEQTRIPVQTKSPKLPKEAWLNKRTGKVLMVPRGIQPGFDRVPGAGRNKPPVRASKAKPTKRAPAPAPKPAAKAPSKRTRKR